MYNSKEKCKEIAQKFKQICEAKGTTPYKIRKPVCHLLQSAAS